MLYLRKKEIKDGVIYYYYQINGEGKWGLLYYNLAKKECGWLELAEGDIDYYPKYRNHAYKQIERYIAKNEFPDNDMVAWG